MLIVIGDFTEVTDIDSYSQLYEIYRHFPIKTTDSYSQFTEENVFKFHKVSYNYQHL